MHGLDNPTATGGTALIAALAIQALKNSGWATWFNRETGKANLFLSLVVAAIAQAGIHWTYDATAGTLVITGLTMAAAHALYQTSLQFSAQHVWYKAIVVLPETLGEIRAMLQRAMPPPISAPEAKTEQAQGKS
jgi:hypothetical protein